MCVGFVLFFVPPLSGFYMLPLRTNNTQPGKAIVCSSFLHIKLYCVLSAIKYTYNFLTLLHRLAYLWYCLCYPSLSNRIVQLIETLLYVFHITYFEI